MKIRFATVVAGAATLTMTGAMLLVGAGAANAAAPPFEGTDPNEIGTLSFYNASGTQITTGSINDSPIAAYTVGSTADAAHTKATLYFYTPKNGVAPSAWSGEQASLSTTYPNTGAPAPINGEGTNPVVTGASTDENLSTYISDFPNSDTSTTDGYGNLYQARIKTSTNGQYQSADLLVSGTTWTQIFPAVKTGTTTTVASSENPSTQGDNVTFTATVTDADSSSPAGAVTFSNGGTTLCTAVAVSSGKATCATTSLPVGTSQTITAAYTPTDTTDFANSSGTVSQTVQAPATKTTTTLSISGNTTTGTDATLSGSVSAADSSHPAGTVSFTDNGSPLTTTPATVAASTTDGSYSATVTGGFSAGSHSVVATFTPTPSGYNSSSSAAVNFTTVKAGGTCVQTGSSCTDTQTIQGEIPTGELIISTPYTAANPLDVGTLALNSTGTEYSGNTTFQCIIVTDSNGANTGFVAQALANPLTQTSGPTPPAGSFSTINGENVGLTGLAPSTTACPNGQSAVNNYTGEPGSVTGHNNPAAAGVAPSDTGTAGLGNAAHTVLSGSPDGVGTATYNGTLTLNAPTTTAAGTYQGTIVFTVSDGE